MESGDQIYTPIIKGKMWDLKALGRVSASTWSVAKPLVEVMPVPKDRTVDQHLEMFAHYLVKHCPRSPIFVDFYGLLPGAVNDRGTPAVMVGFQLLHRMGRIVTPTYGFQRDDSLWTGLRSVVRKFGEGFCFRIDIDDLDDVAEDTWSRIIESSAEMELEPSEIDLVIDLRDIRELSVSVLKDLVIDFLSLKPLDSRYRSIAVAGSSALKTVTDITKDGEDDIERRELSLWSQLQHELGDAQRLVYGDYGVIHPEFSDVGANTNKNAKIRYTVGRNIRYFRGHKLSDPPKFAQYHTLAERVRNFEGYRGRDFSFGDAYIDDCADYRTGPGGLGTWVMTDMNHHLEYSASQVARLQVEIQKATSLEEAEDLLEAI